MFSVIDIGDVFDFDAPPQPTCERLILDCSFVKAE